MARYAPEAQARLAENCPRRHRRRAASDAVGARDGAEVQGARLNGARKRVEVDGHQSEVFAEASGFASLVKEAIRLCVLRDDKIDFAAEAH